MAKSLKSQLRIIRNFISGRFFLDPLHYWYQPSPASIDLIVNRLYPAYLLAKDVRGSIVEFGVGTGRSSQILEAILLKFDDTRHMFLFDSFQGFPALAPEDMTGAKVSLKGDCDDITPRQLEEILAVPHFLTRRRFLQSQGSRIHIYPGFFEQTITEAVLSEINSCGGIAFLHLDCDLYNSYKLCLEKCWDYVNPGGIILFDEYHNSSLEKFPGSRLAIDEFLISRGLDPSKVVKSDSTMNNQAYLIK